MNTFGDEQLAVDLLADKILFEALKFSVGAPSPCVSHLMIHLMTEPHPAMHSPGHGAEVCTSAGRLQVRVL